MNVLQNTLLTTYKLESCYCFYVFRRERGCSSTQSKNGTEDKGTDPEGKKSQSSETGFSDSSREQETKEEGRKRSTLGSTVIKSFQHVVNTFCFVSLSIAVNYYKKESKTCKKESKTFKMLTVAFNVGISEVKYGNKKFIVLWFIIKMS